MTRKSAPRSRRVDAVEDSTPYAVGLDTDDEPVHFLAQGVAVPERFLAWAQADEHRAYIAGSLQRTALQLRGLRHDMDAQVKHLRELGASWAFIGWCVGLSGEAARLRWAHS